VATLTDEPTQPSSDAPEASSEPFGWRPVSLLGRDRRLVAMLALSLAIVVALVLAVALISAASEPPPATGAAALVPADSLLYVHVSTDRTRPAVRRADALLRRLPAFAAFESLLAARVASPLADGSAGISSDVRRWLGNEAAFVVLDTPGPSAGTLIVVDVRDRARARAFLSGRGATADGTYHGVQLLRQPPSTELAFVRHYLVFGQPASVQAAIDAAKGRSPSLQGSSAYQQAAADEPADRVLDAYVPIVGVRRLLEPQGGILGTVGLLLDQRALSAAAVSLSPASGGLRVRVHEALDPTLVKLSGPRPEAFSPTLAAELPRGSTMAVIVQGLRRAAPRILSAAASVGIGAQVAPLLRRLGQALGSEGVNVKQVESVFAGETAVALAPGQSGHGPALVILTRTNHEAATRTLLAQTEVPLAQLFPPPSSGPGTVPEFSDVSVAGITAHELALAPGLELVYAVSHGLVVVSTSAQALGEVISHSRSLADDPSYQAALSGRSDQVTSLLFFDFSQLLSLGEQTGLIGGATLTALQPDLQKFRAIGLSSTSGESDTTAELFIDIP
jgi:hypothetical protein